MHKSRASLGGGVGVARGALMALVAAAAAAGCAADFDTSRATPPRGSLGREMYTMVCDRVGAQALREDVTGESYHAVCHADASGAFADHVDTSKLVALQPAVDVNGAPVPIEQQEKNRAHRVARIEALARRRDDLIAAFDAAFPDQKIGIKDLSNPDPTKSCGPPQGDAPGEAGLRAEVADMLGRLTDLYDDDTIPLVTRALSRVMNDVEASPDAQAALARFDARLGYRPDDVSMGVSRPMLAYPRLVELANALLRLLSADTDPLGMTLPPGAPRKKAADRTAQDRVPGAAHGALVKLLEVAREEMRNSKALPDLPALATAKDPVDGSLVRLSRPRGNLELARTILLAQDPAFSIGSPRWLVARDPRGLAKVALDANGKIPAPFVDLTGPGGKPDGLADVDDLDRFVTNGAPAPSPFATYAAPAPAPRDAFGRALRGDGTEYQYIDVTSTYLASLSRDLVPLLDPDPAKKHETLMDLLAGFVVVAGDREGGADSVRAYDDGAKVTYRAFREDRSPVLDLVWAVGQVLADPTTDDTLALLQQLATEHPALLARLVGVGLRVKAIADAHPEAHIPAASTFWDEMLDVLAQMAQRPALLEDVMRAFADDATLDMPKAAVAYMTMRDHLSYDRGDLNGPPMNVTTGKVEPPVTPVDRGKPDTGDNRSAFQRFLQALHDTNGVSMCTKKGAVAHIVWKGLPMDFPSFTAQAACVVVGADAPPDPMPECGILRVENVAANLVDAVLGTVKLDIRDDCLRKLVASPLTGIVGGADAFLEDVSGIKGWNLHPTVPAINRMAYFDLPHDGLPGDTQNGKTRNFFKDLFDPPATRVCAPRPFTDTDGKLLNLHTCATFDDSLRARDADALFPIETLGFLESSKPLAAAFGKSDANMLFVQLFETLHLHWGSAAQSAAECRRDVPRDDPRWCSGDGAVTYEPLVAEALKTDLFPALHDSVLELSKMTVQHCDAHDPATGACTKSTPYDGVKVLAEAVKAMVDPARNKGLKQRSGQTSVARNDGTTNPQVTPIYLLIDALNGFDARFADHAKEAPGDDRLPAWRRARSQLVDQLFSVDGVGKASAMHNPAVQKMLPVFVSALRSQLAAHCPDPAAASCAWARSELPQKVDAVVTGPTFAALLDVVDAIRGDEAARTELERLLGFLLQSAQGEASKATLTAMVDTLQVFEDDANLTALLRAGAEAAGPEVVDDGGHVASRGLLLAVVEVLSRVLAEVHDREGNRLCSEEIDPNRTLPVVLEKLVTPQDGGKPAPIEVLIDVAADVNRRHPEETGKLVPDDYASIAHEVSDFCSNTTRGLEQVYTVIKQATKDL